MAANVLDEALLTSKKCKITDLNKRCRSSVAWPLVSIPLENVGQKIVSQTVVKIDTANGNDNCKLEMKRVLSAINVDRRAFFQQFTGNHMRILLTRKNPSLLVRCIRDSEESDAISELLTKLGVLQNYTKASYLNDDDIAEFECTVRSFLRDFAATFPDVKATSKMHCLAEHVVLFLRRRKWFGKIPEQSIEALHAQFNLDEKRFSCVRNDDDRVRQILNESTLRNALFDCNMCA